MPISPRRHSGRIYWAALCFLLGCTALIVFVSYWYLFPALSASHDATPIQKRQLAASARLLLAVLLFILLAGLVLTFRIGRFFLPRPHERRTQTRYVDAWAEAGRRAEPPPE